MQLFSDEILDSMKLKTGTQINFEKPYFIFMAKKEIIRDLVIFPNFPRHLSNRELVQLPLFWAMTIITCKILDHELERKISSDQQPIWPVEAIAINFDQWETAGSYDKRLVDCHAHAHFLLNLTFINACDDTFFPKLKDQANDPPNYF